MKKKGISPLIATVLLIGLVISIALLAILWGKNYIEELAEKRGLLAEKQQQCNSVEITSVKAECSEVNCKNGMGRCMQVDVVLKNKRETTVNKFAFRITGNETGEAYEDSSSLKGLEVRPYPVEFPIPGVGCTCATCIKSIDVIPHLRVAMGHYVPCSQQSIKVKIA